MTVRRDRKTDARGIRLGAALLAVCLLAVACLSGTGCSVIFHHRRGAEPERGFLCRGGYHRTAGR
ncbi:MAG: hypothetical protein L6V84_08690 [Oscillospiraceae bacterium]|nr:MAG: hypothetical protein L6V84_08690 [Oscillospiraceae bacterium]